jgi:antitoxin component of RelBE/YafQ-DinJ toxin-antitoxin module
MSVQKSKTQNLVVPLEIGLKNDVKSILHELGLNQSQVVSALYKQISRTRKVPLSFDLNDSRNPTKEESQAIEEFLNRKAKKDYKTTTLAQTLKEIEKLK